MISYFVFRQIFKVLVIAFFLYIWLLLYFPFVNIGTNPTGPQSIQLLMDLTYHSIGRRFAQLGLNRKSKIPSKRAAFLHSYKSANIVLSLCRSFWIG